MPERSTVPLLLLLGVDYALTSKGNDDAYVEV